MNYKLLSLLDELLGTHKKSSNVEYAWPCPFCSSSKEKLAVNIAKGVWHCWVCGTSGKKITSLVKKLDCTSQQLQEIANLSNDVEYVHIENTADTVPLRLPEEYKLLSVPSSSKIYKECIRYLRKRGITLQDILKHRIGYCEDGEYKNRIIVPSYDANNKLNYFVSRIIYDTEYNKAFKYKNPKVSKNVIVFENFINWNYPLVFVEGVFDAFSIKRNVIPLLGKFIPSVLQEKMIEKKVKEVYLNEIQHLTKSYQKY